MEDWKRVLNEYDRRAYLAPMRDLVFKLASTDEAKAFSPSISLATLVLYKGEDSASKVFPHVVIAPLGMEEFELMFFADREMLIETQDVGAEAVFDETLKLLNRCGELQEKGPSRGFPLLCDVIGIMVETKLRENKTSFAWLERSGRLRVKGRLFTGRNDDDMLLFSIPSNTFDEILYFSKSSWLKRSICFTNAKGNVISVLTIGFMLSDGSEIIVSFGSSEEDIDAPREIRGFLETFQLRIKPFVEAEFLRIAEQSS